MKCFPYLALIPAMAICLVGCAASDTKTADPSSTGVAASSTNADEASSSSALSPHGNLQKKFGEPAGITVSGRDGQPEPVLDLTVKSVDVDIQCTSPVAMPAENGHLVSVNVEAKTGAAAPFNEAFYGQDFWFNPADWKFVDARGKTANSVMTTPVFNCLDPQELLRDIGPAEHASGKIVLDLPSTKGTLIYAPSMLDQAWEWPL